MGKYFGTDGVVEKQCRINAKLAFKLGRFIGYVLSQHEEETYPWYLLDVIRVFLVKC